MHQIYNDFVFLFQVYISEIASPDIRGFLSAIQKIAGHMGKLKLSLCLLIHFYKNSSS